MAIRQINLFGEKRRHVWKFGRIFGPRAGKSDSGAEAEIAAFLKENGVSFKSHPFILPAARRRKPAFSEAEKGEIVRKGSGLPAGDLELVLKRTPLARVRPELFRSDFLVEGRRAGRPARVFVEYLGLHNPRTKVTAAAMRRRHYRQIAAYTFVKTPLREELYRRAGLEVVMLGKKDLSDLGTALASVLGMDQEGSTLHGRRFA